MCEAGFLEHLPKLGFACLRSQPNPTSWDVEFGVQTAEDTEYSIAAIGLFAKLVGRPSIANGPEIMEQGHVARHDDALVYVPTLSYS